MLPFVESARRPTKLVIYVLPAKLNKQSIGQNHIEELL